MKAFIVLVLFALVLFCSWKARVILAGSATAALYVIGWNFLAAAAVGIIKVVAEK